MMNLNMNELKIIDFNRVCLDTTLTIAMARGTPGYFPENAEWRNGSKKWDLWSLSAIILEVDMPKKAFKNFTIEDECIKAAENHVK